MKNYLLALAVSAALVTAAPALAEITHFKPKPSETLEEAVANLSEYNAELQRLLAGELTNEAMGQVHELTYTLETALAKIQTETSGIAETLEEVHQASEHWDQGAVKQHGEAYLSNARKLVR